MQVRLELVLGDDLPELLALDLGDLELECGGLARAVAASVGAGAPGGATVDLVEVGELREGLRVAEGHEDEAVVDEGGEEVDDGRLLAAAGGARRDEHGHVLARERALRPELARRIEERLRARQSRSRNERRENAP